MFLPFKIKINEIDNLLKVHKRQICEHPHLEDFLSFTPYHHDCCSKIIDERVNNNKQFIIENIIKGFKIEDNWFPTEELGEFDVFISHSHMDVGIIEEFSTFLDEKLGLKCFIDSLFWKRVDVLLKSLDNQYSLIKSGYYDYKTRNITTANVYMMLSMALMKVMNKSECIIFVDSKNSYDDEGKTTLSPWIYAELCFINMLERREPKRVENKKMQLTEEQKCASELKFLYKDVNTNTNFYELNAEAFIYAKKLGLKSGDALDCIYDFAIGKNV